MNPRECNGGFDDGQMQSLEGKQKLLLISRTGDGYTDEYLDSVSFVPMLTGVDTNR